MGSAFPSCEKCGAEKARKRSALNGAPLCTACKKKQDEFRREWNDRNAGEPFRRESDMAALRAGLNPYA